MAISSWMIINVTGASFLWPFNTIYLHDHLGKSLSVAGMVLMINSLTGVIGNLLGGVLFDKWGGYKSTLVGIVITLVSILGLVFFHGWPLYVVWLALIGFGSGMVFPSMYAMLVRFGQRAEDEHLMRCMLDKTLVLRLEQRVVD